MCYFQLIKKKTVSPAQFRNDILLWDDGCEAGTNLDAFEGAPAVWALRPSRVRLNGRHLSIVLRETEEQNWAWKTTTVNLLTLHLNSFVCCHQLTNCPVKPSILALHSPFTHTHTHTHNNQSLMMWLMEIKTWRCFKKKEPLNSRPQFARTCWSLGVFPVLQQNQKLETLRVAEDRSESKIVSSWVYSSGIWDSSSRTNRKTELRVFFFIAWGEFRGLRWVQGHHCTLRGFPASNRSSCSSCWWSPNSSQCRWLILTNT